MENDPVVLALRAAIASRDSVELRVALARHLLEKGDARAALAEYEAGLALVPAHVEALEGAVKAAESAGETAKAAAYRLALGARVAAPPPAPPPSSTPPAETVSRDESSSEDSSVSTATREAQERPRLRLVAEGGDVVEDEAPPPLTFKDVGGMDEVKARLERSFLGPLKNPEMYRKFGKKLGAGLILYGPPGCGKTFLARAAAGEIGARFVNVALSDVLDMWFGESEKRLHELFENARRRAPTLVFFDEADALGQRRSELKGSVGRRVVNQLLAELDGFAGRNEAVFVLAATNHPWDLDPALRRPGRFDRMVFVPPPDATARKKILDLKLHGRPLASALDLVAMAKRTDGFSGADIESLVETATELAIDASVKGGTEVPIDDAMMKAALADTRGSTRPWFELARNYALYANEGGSYDDLLAHLKSIGLA